MIFMKFTGPIQTESFKSTESSDSPVQTRQLAVVVLVCITLATPVLAHVPGSPGDNTSPGTAYRVSDPAKSWSFYDRLEGNQTRYYELRLDPGDRLKLGLFTPAEGEFRPSLFLLGPDDGDGDGIDSASADTPDRVYVPRNYTAVEFEGERPTSPRFELFTPAAYYHTLSLDRRVEEGGRYLLAVYEPEARSGNVGVAIGHSEQFTIVEYVTIPVDLIGVHLWSGHHPAVVLGPTLAVLVGGIIALGRRIESGGGDRPLARYAVGLGGLLVLGSGFDRGLQLVLVLSAVGPVPTAAVTAVFVAGPLLVGAWLVSRAASGPLDRGLTTRAVLTVAAVVGVAFWGGYLVGPALVFLGGIGPFPRLERVRVGS
jgi:hypothetical protein